MYDRLVSRCVLVLLLCVAGCKQLLGIEDLEGPADATLPGEDDSGAPQLECQAQRVVHIVSGNGGFAWFTLVWPVPFIIENPKPTFAYDDASRAKSVVNDQLHRLYSRTLGVRSIWDGTGQAPHPSVFVAGRNEAHSATPQTIVRSAGFELVAAGATIQASLAPPLPVLAFELGQPYGPAEGAPPAVLVTSIDGAIDALRGTGATTPVIEAQLRPSQAQLARYHDSQSPAVVVNLATQLAFTANAFRFGLIGSVILPGFEDDPHGAFAVGGVARQRADELATMLDAFYADLAASSERSCGRDGNFLPLADNVVLIATGDTPKDSFTADGWPDGTPAGSNWVYVRSNGFTRPGWFGEISPGLRVNFDPTTGAPAAGAATPPATAAAVAGMLFAIARGDLEAVRRFTNAPFSGVVLAP